MEKVKKISQPVYLTPEQKKFVKGESNKDGITMNAFIVSLINAAMRKK